MSSSIFSIQFMSPDDSLSTYVTFMRPHLVGHSLGISIGTDVRSRSHHPAPHSVSAMLPTSPFCVRVHLFWPLFFSPGRTSVVENPLPSSRTSLLRSVLDILAVMCYKDCGIVRQLLSYCCHALSHTAVWWIEWNRVRLIHDQICRFGRPFE